MYLTEMQLKEIEIRYLVAQEEILPELKCYDMTLSAGDVPALLAEIARLRRHINDIAPFLAAHGFFGYSFQEP